MVHSCLQVSIFKNARRTIPSSRGASHPRKEKISDEVDVDPTPTVSKLDSEAVESTRLFEACIISDIRGGRDVSLVALVLLPLVLPPSFSNSYRVYRNKG